MSDVASQAVDLKERLARGGRLALGVGVAGLAVCAVLGLRSREAMMQAYLLAFLYWLALALGSFSLLLLQHITGGRWGLAIRRLLEAAASTLPAMVVLFLPILFQLDKIYAWARPAAATDELLQKKAAYLNPLAFGIRAAVYFALWILISRALVRWSRRLDQRDDPTLVARMRRLSAPGLVIYSLTVTFAAFDWGMSLEPHWYSTMYGVIYAAGAALAALAFAIVVLARLAPRGPHATFLNPITVGDLGNLSLAFTMFWTYVSLSQFLIIWAGHLPEERPWYAARMHGGWQVVGLGLLIFQFALPFLLLISRDRKRDLSRLARTALYILVMRFVDLFWIIVPAFSATLRLRFHDLAAMVGLGGIWLWLYLRALAAAPLLPARVEDPAGGAHHD